MPARIIIGGDIVPTESNYELFKSGDVNTLIGEELQSLLGSADFKIFNLEVPLTDVLNPIRKNGPALIAPTGCVTGLKGINPCFFTLANNHILDQGVDGLLSTTEELKNAGIQYAGVGENIKDAARPFIFTYDDIKIGIYCCVEHEFSVATGNAPGANPFDPLESPDHVANLKAECDYVVILYHGGKEHYRYPSPELQKRCRKFVDKGADIVICQHSHCIGCEEKWNSGTIVYGQGNFLFDNSKSEFWKTGLLVEVLLDAGTSRITYIPIVKKGETVRRAGLAESEQILKKFVERTEEIKGEWTIVNKKDTIYDENFTGISIYAC